MAERELLVRIVGDDRDLQRALKNTERSTQRIDNRMAAFGKSVKGTFAAAGIAFGTAAAFSEIERAVASASDLNEQTSRIKVILGESAQATIEWSKTTATSYGISQRAALAASATFAGLFQTVGVAQAEAGRLSRSLVQLAADLASLQNTSTAEALTALRSGLAGEAEPLRRFNIFLTEARVQMEALAETGKKTTSSLTAQEKTVARYNLILQDAAPSLNNFKDTSQELANQQRILAAQVDDLEASLGQVLIPTLTDVVGTLNQAVTAAKDLQVALGGLQGIGVIDIPINMPISIIFKQGRGKDLKGGLSDLKDNIGEALQDAFSAGTGPFKDLLDRARGGGGRGFTFFPAAPERTAGAAELPTKKAADKQEDDAKKIENDAKRAKAAKERQRKAFAEFLKGLGLKLETAELKSPQDELAVLREIERGIERQINREGRTFKLAEQLVRVRGEIQDKLAEISNAQEERHTAKVKAVADKAKQEGDKRKRIREQAAAARKADQFEDLGLTSEGDKRTPGSGALLARAKSLQDQVKGTPLDTPKTRSQLERIVSVLKKNFKKAGKDVRGAILEMLNDISNAMDGKDAKSGPLTKTTSLNSKKLLENLGLSPEEIRALRGRLSNFNSAGVGFAGANNTRSTGSFSAPIVVENHLTLNLDGQKLATSVTRNQQKTKKRNPQQKRGPNRR